MLSLLTRAIRLSAACVAFCCFAQAYPQQGLTPQQIYTGALQRYPNLLAARQRIVEAQAKIGEVGAQNQPGLSFTGTASENRGTLPAQQGTNTFTNVSGGLQLTFPNGRRAAAAMRAARSQMSVARAELRRSLADLAFRSSDAYFGLLKAQDAVTIAQQNLDQANLQVSDTQKRIAAGDVPQADILKVQVPAEQARAALARANNALRVARQTLNGLLQQPLDEDISAAPAPTNLPFKMTQQEAVVKALDSSPDVLVARAGVVTAESNLEVVRRANDPSFALQGSHAYSTDPTTYMNLTSMGLSLTIPLFDGGIVRNQVRQAESQLQQAKFALSQAEINTRLSTSSAFVDVQSAASDLESFQRVLDIAVQSAAKSRQSYLAGLTTTRDVLEAERSLAQARLDVSNARYAYALAQAKLRQLLGEENP